jgi:rhodanese-related sulfurtransferase
MTVPEIDVAALAARRADGVPILDVRNPDEYVEGHVPGAVLIPLPDLVERVDEVPDDGQPLYVICAVGGRSARAAEYLRGQGIDAINIAGGTVSWIEAGHPVVTGEQPG